MKTASGFQQITKNSRGFSLIELIIVLFLLSIVIAGVYQLFFFSQSSWTRSAAESRAIQDARNVLMQMDREIRQARSPNEGTPPVVFVASDEIRVYSDVRGDGRPEMISYHCPGSQGQEEPRPLQRSVVDPDGDEYPYTYDTPSGWIAIADNVWDCVFSVEGTAPRLAVNVRLFVDDPETHLARPVEVQAKLIVRSRGGAD